MARAMRGALSASQRELDSHLLLQGISTQGAYISAQRRALRKSLNPFIPRQDGPLERATAAKLLDTASAVIEGAVHRQLKHQNQVPWMITLRILSGPSCPPLFYDTAWPQTRFMAEAFSAQYASSTHTTAFAVGMLQLGRSGVVIGEAQLQDLVKLLVRSEQYAWLQSARQHLKMGATLEIRNRRICTTNDEEAQTLVDLFHRRMRDRQDEFSGVVGADLSASHRDPDNFIGSLLRIHEIQEQGDAALHSRQWRDLLGADWWSATTRPRFLWDLQNMGPAVALIKSLDQELPDQHLRTLQYFLLLAHRSVKMAIAPDEWVYSVPFGGYTVSDVQSFSGELANPRVAWREVIQQNFPDNQLLFTMSELVECCEWAHSVCGLAGLGHVIRTDGAEVFVDLFSLSIQLSYLLNIAINPGGPLANIRGRMLEQNIQDAINASKWAPPAELASLLNRNLQLPNGRGFELDALAVIDDVIVIIDAKSRVRTPDYDMASANTVWNTSLTTAADYRKLSDLVLNLTSHRDSWLPSRYANFSIEGIVCIPGPLFLHEAECVRSDNSLGVMNVCTLEELTKALV